MLQNLPPEVAECLRQADDCAQRAKREPDPSLRRDYFDMELRCLKLARSYLFADQLRSFTAHNRQRHEELTERLDRLRRKLTRKKQSSC
jgi:hypothetical protein